MNMEIIRVILKIIMWVLIVGFACNFIMQAISYSFYKGAKKMTDINITPQFIQMTDTLTGYGYHLDVNADTVIVFFGGSNYIAYNSVGKFADRYECPFIAADYYGTQDSKGKMNLKTMKNTALDMYSWVKQQYPNSKIIVMGHSYGCGIATYLASTVDCQSLIIAAGYRDISDLYNKILPVFIGPFKVFISNNILASQYAKDVKCPVYIFGSTADRTLNASIQEKFSKYFNYCEIKIFDNIAHEDYFTNDEVTKCVLRIIEN
jgi:pimeloyl-ACP methyl ester carboxylesterase